MSREIHVVVTGAAGKMGREVVKAVLKESDLVLVGAIDSKENGVDVGALVGINACGVVVSSDLQKVLENTDADVLVDFTNPEAAVSNGITALNYGVIPIIGTTGIDDVEIDELRKAASKTGLGVLIAPNFALGAVLMMDFARRAARHFKHVEIIEMHHDQKIDAPSGTSLKTAQMIQEERLPVRQGHPDEYEKIKGVRGGELEGIRIHSVRLPGFVAHQEVIFGGLGQVLTIRHDSLSRESFMPGVVYAIRKARTLQGVVVGLEKILD
ncbi:MAG TPA: 4-hydroxy-tetrahydrodipicolinate reductase [Syntrophomonadaceae bacterium]|nr:4-hydroxy-tetrahydrodipicolinate reductase [Syntrophomonadaceae bacterium]